MKFSVPYGRRDLGFSLPDGVQAKTIVAQEAAAAADALAAVEAALAAPLGGVSLADFRGARTAAIAINDKTRPVPHQHLLPPLLRQLEDLGLSPSAIRLIIATGVHPPMPPDEFPSVVPEGILARYAVTCHDGDARASLRYLGTTSRGTPIWINRQFELIFSRMKVSDKKGPVGEVNQKFSLLNRRYELVPYFGSRRLTLTGPIFRPWTFNIQSGTQQLGSICKKWSGLMKEAFTRADTFEVSFDSGDLQPAEKKLILAAAIAVDIDYFEQKQKR